MGSPVSTLTGEALSHLSALSRYLSSDREYPVDQKRGGSPDDMKNLVQLLADMRQHSGFGHNFGISVTLAPDLWYLQHYDAKGLLQNADFLGFMAYDLHGIWVSRDFYLGDNR